MVGPDSATGERRSLSRIRLFGGVAGTLLLLAAAFLLGRSTGEGEDGTASTGSTGRERADANGFALLSTHRCPTELTVKQPFVHVARQLAVPLSTAVGEELAVYASSVGSTLVGPQGWECRATMGVDGGQIIGLRPPGSERPAWFAGEGDPAVMATIEPACAGCIASMICAFLPQEAVVQTYAAYEDCPRVPASEGTSHVSRSTVLFVDPAEVKGTGVGSGGSLQSLGAVTYGESSGARRISCTLPPELAGSCPDIVGAILAMG